MSKFDDCADDNSCADGSAGLRARSHCVRHASGPDSIKVGCTPPGVPVEPGTPHDEPAITLRHVARLMRANACERVLADAAVLLPRRRRPVALYGRGHGRRI